MSEQRVPGDRATDAGTIPAGEDQGQTATFTVDQIARAFAVVPERVQRALAGEFNLGSDARVDSRQAQHLAEVLLGDEELAEREAALMRLGAFTPRPDEEWGIGDRPPGQESDRYAASADKPADVRASRDASYDPSQPTG